MLLATIRELDVIAGSSQTADEGIEIDWWKGLNDEQRKDWMARAGNTGVAADAWTAYKKLTIKQLGKKSCIGQTRRGRSLKT